MRAYRPFGIMDRKITNRRDKRFIPLPSLNLAKQIGKRVVFFCQRVQRMPGYCLQFGGAGVLIRVVLLGKESLFASSSCAFFRRREASTSFSALAIFLLRCRAMEQGGVDVAEPLHFRKRRSLFHEFLLCLHDLRCLDVR